MPADKQFMIGGNRMRFPHKADDLDSGTSKDRVWLRMRLRLVTHYDLRLSGSPASFLQRIQRTDSSEQNPLEWRDGGYGGNTSKDMKLYCRHQI